MNVLTTTTTGTASPTRPAGPGHRLQTADCSPAAHQHRHNTMAPATPRTPAPHTPQLHTPNGTWKHPQFDEITRRQYAATFDEGNVKAVVANAGLLLASFFADAVTSKVKLLEYAAYVCPAPPLFPHRNRATGHPSTPLCTTPLTATGWCLLSACSSPSTLPTRFCPSSAVTTQTTSPTFP